MDGYHARTSPIPRATVKVHQDAIEIIIGNYVRKKTNLKNDEKSIQQNL